MKNCNFLLMVMFFSLQANAQIFKDFGKKLEERAMKKVEQKAEQKVDRHIDKTLDKADKKSDEKIEDVKSGKKPVIQIRQIPKKV